LAKSCLAATQWLFAGLASVAVRPADDPTTLIELIIPLD
jgi:hypothetical protein